MDKVKINDKDGERTVFIMTTCPNHKALMNKHGNVKPVVIPPTRLMINDKPYTSIGHASDVLRVSRYMVTQRINSTVSKWKRWTRVKVVPK